MQDNELIDSLDRARLELGLSVRENIVRDLTKNGEMPKSQEDRAFLLQSIEGMDRTILSRTKIKVEDKVAQNQQQSARAIAELLTRIPLAVPNSQRTVIIELPKDVIVDNPVHGEMDISPKELSYEIFTASM